MATPMHDDSDRIPPELAADEQPFGLEDLDAALSDWSPTDVPKLLEAWADDSPDDYTAERAAVMRWSVTDDGSAEWAMAMVAELDANATMLREQEKAYVERIARHYRRQQAQLAQRRAFFAAHLTVYAAAWRARDPKRNKTLHLPSGLVRSTDHKPKAIVRDDATVAAFMLEYLEPADAAAVVKMEPRLTELRKHVQIVLRPIGYVVTLECGHEHHVPAMNPATDTPHTPEQLRADGMPCDQCDPDPIDGWLHQRVTRVANWDERVVVIPHGDGYVPVAGADVDPGGITFTVSPS